MSFRLAPALAAMLAIASVTACDARPARPTAEKDRNAPYAVVVRPGANLPSKKEIAALFDTWNDMLQTGGPNDIAQLYAEDAVLLPTLSNQLRANRVEIANYFDDFQRQRPRGTINEQHIDVLDTNTAVNSGIYTFDIIKEGRPDFVVARYSFLYEKIGGKWLIKSHHSSAMPEMVTARPAPLSQVLAANAAVATVASPVAGHAKSEAPAARQ